MRITIIGSGSSKGIPRTGHRDPLCRDARRDGSKSRRRRSSALVLYRGKRILIDVSPDFLEQMKNARVKRLDAIVLTHAHADATGGLRNFRDWYHSLIRTNERLKIPLYANPKTINALHRKIPAAIRPIAVRPFSTADVAGVPITFIPVRHGVRGIATYGFLFGKKLFFASDMDGTSPRAVRLIRGVHAAVVDGAFWNYKRLRGHFAVPETLEFAKKIKPQHLIITQSGHTYPPHAVAERTIRHLAKQKNCTFPVQLSYDGMKRKL